jgi:hypothetical protein
MKIIFLYLKLRKTGLKILCRFIKHTHLDDLKYENDSYEFKCYKTQWQQIAYNDLFKSIVHVCSNWFATNEKLEFSNTDSMETLEIDIDFIRCLFVLFDCLIDSVGLVKMIRKGMFVKLLKIMQKYSNAEPVRLLKVFPFKNSFYYFKI